MTREEAKKQFWQVSRDGYSGVFERVFNIKFNDVLKMPYHGSEVDKFIDKIYDSFEQRIADLSSPKTCEGCRYENCSRSTWELYCIPCLRDKEDLFEPKDTE